MDWFRLYTEARNDAKLRALDDAQFRVWFNLLCLAADQPERGLIEGRKLPILALECAGGDRELLVQTLGLLSDLDILDCDLSDLGVASCPRLAFLHFKKRQYTKPSDRPERVAERVNRQKKVNRAESRGIAPDTETDSETESDSEQNNKEKTPPYPPQAGDPLACKWEEKITPRSGEAGSVPLSESLFVLPKIEYSARFEKFWRDEYPRHEAKTMAWRVWKRLGLESNNPLLRRIVKDVRQRRQGAQWRERGGEYIPQLSSYLNGRRWEDDLSPSSLLSGTSSNTGLSYGARDVPLVRESQPITYAAYRKRLEAYLAMEESGAAAAVAA